MAVDMSPHGLRQLAASIGVDILACATECPDGTIAWGRGFDVDFGPVPDAGLFSGRVGEALLFAALADAIGDTKFADAANRAAAALCSEFENMEDATSMTSRIGLGVTGLGSILYAFARIGEYLGLDVYIRAARRCVRAISPRTFESESRCDVYWGGAGLILGLLSVADTGDEEALETASACARFLLGERVFDPVSRRAVWLTGSSVPSSGFAHGNSGIAYALLELDRRLGRPTYTCAALDAFDFERTLWRESMNNWLDFRGQEHQVLCSWCHGAPGIGMARLGAIGIVGGGDSDLIARDLSMALRATLARPAMGLQTLCCGALGRADFLLDAGIRLSSDSLLAAANRLLEVSILAARRDGFIVSPANKPHQGSGTWQGLTGIAYEILRFSDPTVYPSILRFASPYRSHMRGLIDSH